MAAEGDGRNEAGNSGGRSRARRTWTAAVPAQAGSAAVESVEVDRSVSRSIATKIEAATTEPNPIPEPVADTVPTPSTEAPVVAPTVDEDGDTVLGTSPAVSPAAAADQFIVQVEDGAALTEVVADATADGVTITNTLNGAVTGFTAPLDAASVAELRGHDDVVAVERDKQIEFSGVQNGATWGLDRIDQRALPLNSRYSYRAHGRRCRRAYVIDSGIRPTHADFTGRVEAVVRTSTSVTAPEPRTATVTEPTSSGTIGGSTWGVAKAVTIVPVKVVLLLGQHAATRHRLRGQLGDRQPRRRSARRRQHEPGRPGIDGPGQRRAGDDRGRDHRGRRRRQRSAEHLQRQPGAGLAGDHGRRVDDRRRRRHFSNYGACNDLFAPGVGIRSASHTSDTGSLAVDGTSMASPHVAGAAALVLQRNPSATPAQVWAAIDADTTRGVLSECCGDPDKLLRITQPPARPPGVPAGLRAAVAPSAGVRSGQVRLTWSAPTSNGGATITDYVIQRSVGGRSWSVVRDGTSTARALTLSRLANGTTYQFRVAAKNSVGVGPWSTSTRATPAWTPSAPRRLRAAAAPARGVGSRQVKLSWLAPRSTSGSRINDYIIQRSANGRKWVTIRDGVSRRTVLVVSRLTNGTSYRFRVATRNSVGPGPFSGSVRATPRPR